MKKLVTVLYFVLSLVGCSHKTQYKIPVIAITDLYYPGQDVGDNFDILTPYALENIDLKAVVFDVSNRFRECNEDNTVLRDPGFIPVTQLNYLFDKSVPCGCSPFDPLDSLKDAKLDVPTFEQNGIELIFKVLEEAESPVHIVSTGSLRPLAIAYNRRPDLLSSEKVAAIHICAGSSSENFVEWNINLDTLAAARVLSSDMKMNIYPCATENGPFDLGDNNSFWALWDLDWILGMQPELRNYIVYNLISVPDRPDFLRYLEEPLPERDAAILLDRREDKWYGSGGKHYVWETAVWQQVAGLVLVQHQDTTAELVKSNEISDTDRVFIEGLKNVSIEVNPNGTFRWNYIEEESRIKIYYREGAFANQVLLGSALPKLYIEYTTD